MSLIQGRTTEFFHNDISADRTYGKSVVSIEESDLAIERVQDNNVGGIYCVSASEIMNNCGLKIIPITRYFGGESFSVARQKNVCNKCVRSQQFFRYTSITDLEIPFDTSAIYFNNNK